MAVKIFIFINPTICIQIQGNGGDMFRSLFRLQIVNKIDIAKANGQRLLLNSLCQSGITEYAYPFQILLAFAKILCPGLASTSSIRAHIDFNRFFYESGINVVPILVTLMDKDIGKLFLCKTTFLNQINVWMLTVYCTQYGVIGYVDRVSSFFHFLWMQI